MTLPSNLPSNHIFVADVAGLMLDECYRFEKEELIAEFKFLEDEKGKDGKREKGKDGKREKEDGKRWTQ